MRDAHDAEQRASVEIEQMDNEEQSLREIVNASSERNSQIICCEDDNDSASKRCMDEDKTQRSSCIDV